MAASSALAAGVPLVGAGTTEENPEVANRIAWAGVGVNLKKRSPPEQVRRAVQTVLDMPSFQERTRRLQGGDCPRDAPTEAAVLLERLTQTRQPVLRAGGKFIQPWQKQTSLMVYGSET